VPGRAFVVVRPAQRSIGQPAAAHVPTPPSTTWTTCSAPSRWSRLAATALRCPDAQRIDRVFYRSSSALTISPRKWRIDRRFTDAKGQPLSDHLAVAVELDWKSHEPSSH